MLYTPRGPVMDYTNERLVSYFMAELKKIWQEKRALFIKNGSSGSLSRFSFGRRTPTAC